MLDALGPNTILGYCTNVHAGTTVDEIKSNLNRYAVAVKERVSPGEPMGVGLWFPASAAQDAVENNRVDEIRAFLSERGLLPFTLNGFPYDNFHQNIVKHSVYLPDWADPRRAAYTQQLAEILHGLLPDGAVGSISTLPLGWRGRVGSGWEKRLADVVHWLDRLYKDTGRLIHIDIEPEPGCAIDRTADLATGLFTENLIVHCNEDALRRHLRICLDVCHQAVMFEPALELLEWSRSSGYKIGKVQISSGLRSALMDKSPVEEDAIKSELSSFVEPRYLHQTVIGIRENEATVAFFDDLPDAFAAADRNAGEWRTHFHVPIYLKRIGTLDTTQDAIVKLLDAIKPSDEIHHFEVETYAWGVLPERLQPGDLATGIAEEIQWVKSLQNHNA